MKKLLSILASVTLVASSSAAVVSCSNTTTKSTPGYLNNNLNNIMGASLEKAKSVIINNEYGVDQSIINKQQSKIKVSEDNLKDIDYNDLANKKDTHVDDLVHQYYGNIDNTNDTTQGGSRVDLGGTNGVTSTFDYLLQKAMNALGLSPIIQNAVLRSKDGIINFLNLTKDTVNMTNVNSLNVSGYNTSISGSEYIINVAIKMGINYVRTQLATETDTNGTWHTVAKAIASVLNDKNKFANVTLPNIFGNNKVVVDKAGTASVKTKDSNKTMMMIRAIMSSMFDKGKADDKGITHSKIQDSVYQNTALTIPNFDSDSATATPTISMDPSRMVSQFGGNADLDSIAKLNDGNISVKDFKKEFVSSLDRLMNIVLNKDILSTFKPADSKPDNATKLDAGIDYSKSIDDFQNNLSGIIELLINGQIKTDKRSVNGKETTLPYVTITDKEGKTSDADLFSRNMLSSDLTSVKPNQQTVMAIVWEALRDVCLMNGQFSMFEDSYDYQAKDSMHLFDADKSNYEYLNDKSKLTIKDLNYFKVKDEPINLNYLLSNLNYYMGKMKDANDQSAYRFQKLLFIVLNDPEDSMITDGTTSSNTWIDKQSDILDIILNVGLKVGTAYAESKADPADPTNTYNTAVSILKGFDNDADKTTLENSLLKPIILGLVNGNNFQPAFDAIEGGIHGASTIPDVKKLFQSIKALGINMDDILVAIERFNDMGIGKDTIHNLFMDDFRNVINPLKIIPQEWKDKLFGPDLPVNLTTIVNMSLSKILSMLGVSGFEGGKISPIGDTFTTHSIPWLINRFNEFLNNNATEPNVIPDRYITYPLDGNGKPDESQKPDYAKSLKSRDINFQAIYDMFISIAGTNTDNEGKEVNTDDKKDNIFSLALNDLLDTLTKDGKPVTDDLSNADVQLNPSKFSDDLGIKGQEVSSDSTPAKSFVKKDDQDLAAVSLGTGTLGSDLKTITFDDTQGLTQTINTDVSKANAKEGTITVSNGSVTSATVDKGKLTVVLSSPVTQLVKNTTLTVEYYAPGVTPVFPSIPAATAFVTIPGTNPDAVINLKIKSQSILGAFYRLNLPKINQDQPSKDPATDLFTMDNKYLDTDLLRGNYKNFIKVLMDFNSPAYYNNFVMQILRNDKAFKFEVDPKKIKYFENNKKLVKELTYKVVYKNYVVGRTNTYVFTVSRSSNTEVFKIIKLITNKID